MADVSKPQRKSGLTSWAGTALTEAYEQELASHSCLSSIRAPDARRTRCRVIHSGLWLPRQQ